MKYDSHIKLTNAALRILRSRCPVSAATCNAPLFKATPRIWIHDAKRSTAIDNATAAAGGIANLPLSMLLPALFPIELGDAVSMVDVNTPSSHFSPAGQRYHFMAAPGEGQYTAYSNALGFIHSRTLTWANLARELLKKRADPHAHASPSETRSYQRALALALHALQDSFSTGHTLRSFDDGVPENIRSVGSLTGAAPIRELFVFKKQDKEKHADDDYTSGGLDSPAARVAIEATVDLITMGLVSIKKPGGLHGWNAFVHKWLPEKLRPHGDMLRVPAAHAAESPAH